MFHLIVDTPFTDIVANEKRRRRQTFTEARKHCLKKNSSLLWSYKILPDCKNLTRFMTLNSQYGKRRYWTGLYKNETDDDKNKLCDTVIGEQLHNCNNNSDECVSVKIRGADVKHRLEECDDRRYIVCQVNKGNEIFS